MDHKKEYRNLVLLVKSKLMMMGKPHKSEDIAKALGYNRTYFSSLVGERGIVTDDHVIQLKRAFPFVESDVSTLMVNEPETEKYETKYHPDHVKYMSLLEDNIEFLKGVMISNLGTISVGQQHLRALAIAQLNQVAKIRAREEGRPVSKVMDEINKEVADAALSIEQMDILSDIQGKKVKS